MTEWQRFRQQTVGNSEMLSTKDKEGLKDTTIYRKSIQLLQVDEWRARGDSFSFEQPVYSSNSPSMEDR